MFETWKQKLVAVVVTVGGVVPVALKVPHFTPCKVKLSRYMTWRHLEGEEV
jgi:hypothetical protein